MFRDGRRAPASARETAQARRRAPFWTAVSRLLSAPEGLLFNFRSRYSLRYRTRARIQPWEGGTSRIRATRSSSATAPARARGPPGCHRVPPALPGRSPPPPCTPATARARLLPFRSPLLREPRLLSPPGLTDMLKFGPSPRPAQGGTHPPTARPEDPPPRSCAAAPHAGFPPRIRKVTIRIGLRLAATNLAPFYVLRRRPSPVIHYCLLMKSTYHRRV